MGQTIWWIFLEKIFFFGSWLERLLTFGQKHYRNVVKTNFYLLRKPVDEIYFFEFSNVFDTYADFGRKCFWLLAIKCYHKVIKLLLFAFREYTWKIIIFFFEKIFLVWIPNFEWSCFWLSAKFLQRGCQNCSLRVRETNWRNRFFAKFLVFMYLWTSSETFFDFSIFLYAILSKLLSTSSNELFDQKTFEKIPILLRRFVIKTFSYFSQKCT